MGFIFFAHNNSILIIRCQGISLDFMDLQKIVNFEYGELFATEALRPRWIENYPTGRHREI